MQNNKLEIAKKAITDFFGDKSILRSETLEGLEELGSDIDSFIEALQADIDREEAEAIEAQDDLM